MLRPGRKVQDRICVCPAVNGESHNGSITERGNDSITGREWVPHVVPKWGTDIDVAPGFIPGAGVVCASDGAAH